LFRLIGNHFTSIVDKQDDKQKKSNVDPEVNQLLQDEQIRELLLDSDVIKLMKMLREEPDKAQWYKIFILKFYIRFIHLG